MSVQFDSYGCFKPSILQPIVSLNSFAITFTFQLPDLPLNSNCNFSDGFHLATIIVFVFSFDSFRFNIQRFHCFAIEVRYPLIFIASPCSHYTFIAIDLHFYALLFAIASINSMMINWSIGFKDLAIFNWGHEIGTGHCFNIFHRFMAGFSFKYTCLWIANDYLDLIKCF